MDPALQRIDQLTEQRYSLVYFETMRSVHVVDMFKSLSLGSSKAIYHWSEGDGLYRMDASHIMIPRTQKPEHVLELIRSTPHFGIYILSGFEEALKNQRCVELLQKIIANYQNNPKMVVILGSNIEFPATLRASIAHIRHTMRPAGNSTRKAS